jgi:hypothetical protein
MRAGLFALIALAAAPAAAQDTGALYNEQVRRNQVYGVVGQPPPVAIPPRPGVGAYYHDEVRLRQEGRLGPVLPTRPVPGPRVLDDGQRVVQLQETNVPGRRASSGIRATVRRTTPPRRVVVIRRERLPPLNRFD